ncbi:MAG: DNA starvation/stationary phase protection protein [Opitutae bacterium]|nr:DNA starvation/stationary phase protection protein [Opitutae bacterium]
MNKDLVSKLNKYLANIAVMYVKTHNLHWNVVGKNFKAVHEYLESIYDDLAESFDAVAEALKMHGEQPVASLAGYLELATVKEIPSEEICSCKAFEIVKADLTELKAQGEAICAACDSGDLSDVVAVVEEDLGKFTKAIWFITATLK